MVRDQEDRVARLCLLLRNRKALLHPIAHCLGIAVRVSSVVRACADKVEAVDGKMAVRVLFEHALVKLVLGGRGAPIGIEPGIMIAHDAELIGTRVFVREYLVKHIEIRFIRIPAAHIANIPHVENCVDVLRFQQLKLLF